MPQTCGFVPVLFTAEPTGPRAVAGTQQVIHKYLPNGHTNKQHFLNMIPASQPHLLPIFYFYHNKLPAGPSHGWMCSYACSCSYWTGPSLNPLLHFQVSTSFFPLEPWPIYLSLPTLSTSKRLSLLGVFPGSPMVKAVPSNARGAGSNPGQRAKIPTCLVVKRPKHTAEIIL